MRTLRTLTYGLCVAFILIPLSTTAQALNEQIIPANPTTADSVTLRFTWTDFFAPVVTRVGNHFRVEVFPCTILCPTFTLNAPLGTLPAGSYTYEIVLEGDPTPLASGAFVVTAHIPEAPALSPAALAAFCALLMGVGWMVVGRRS